MSDIHVDFYCVQTALYDTVLPDFEDVYKKFFLPADTLILAGDVANDYATQIHFYRFLGTKYNDVYITFGNHDLVVKGATFGNGNHFSKSENRINAVMREFRDDKHVHILEGRNVNGFAGCMGMCDFSYKSTKFANYFSVWQHRWFDGRHWRYQDNRAYEIWQYYENMMNNLVKTQPKFMITHFVPEEIGINPAYADDLNTTFFHFKANKFLEQMPNDSYWICGHTHDAWKVDYTNSNGNVIHLLCNPVGYPHEDPLSLNYLKKEDFLIEIQ